MGRWTKHSLVEAFYRPQHFHIAAGRSHEVNDNACARIAGSDSRSNTAQIKRLVPSSSSSGEWTYRCAYSSTALGKSGKICISDHSKHCGCQPLTVINNQRDLGDLRRFDLNIIDDEHLCRRRTHDARRRPELVQRSELRTSVHVTMLTYALA